MAKKNKKGQSKKGLQTNILARLDAALSEYHVLVGEKKFTKHLKKTAKLFANDIANATKKEQEKLAKDVKKIAKKGAEKNDHITPLKKKGKKKTEPVISKITATELEKPAD